MSLRPLGDRILERARRLLRARSRGGVLWQGLSAIGAVGWMMALPTVAGAMLGHYLDQRFDTGGSLTIGLLLAGLAIGGYSVWRLLVREGEP